MNFRFELKRATVLAMMLTAGSAVVAQVTTGAMSGAVRDAKGNPIAGARVALTSPALFSPRITVTDDKGEWRAPMLPPGSYVVTATKDGYVGVPSREIRVGLGASIRQDVILKLASTQSAVVEVVASGEAVVDKADTKVASNYSAEQLSIIPASDRSFTGAADLTPGITFGGTGNATVRGGSSNNTLFRVNGVDIKDDLQGERTGVNVIDDLIEDVQVVTSPLNARFGRTSAGAINVVTKTGGNEFSGSIRAILSRASWAATDLDERSIDIASTLDNLNKQYDVTFMGPIWKDHIWFSIGTVLTPDQKYGDTLSGWGDPNVYNDAYHTGNTLIDGYVANTALHGNTFTPLDSRKPFSMTEKRKYLEGKITGQITPDHTVEMSYSWEKDDLTNRDPYSGGGMMCTMASLGSQSSDGKAYGFGYRGLLSSKVFLEARFNKNDNVIQFPSGEFGQFYDPILLRVHNLNSAATLAFGTGIPPYPQIRASRSGNINLQVYADAAGQHQMDMGFDFFEGRQGTADRVGRNNRRFRAGGFYLNQAGELVVPTIVWPGRGAYAQSGSGLTGLAPVIEKFYGEDGMAKNTSRAVYFNDAWTINSHWNLMVGLRYNAYKIGDTDKKDLAKSHSFEPRFELKFDPLGNSKHVFSLSLARLAGDFYTGFTTAFITSATAKSAYIPYKGIAGQPALPANPADIVSGWDGGQYGVRFITYDQLVDEANYNLQAPFAYANNSQAWIIDSGLKAPYADEFTIGYNRTYENGGKFRLTYVYRKWRQEWAIAQDYMPDQWALTDDPTGAGLAPTWTQRTRIFNSDELRREYNGLEMEWKANLSQAWSWGGSATYSRLVGNNNGGDQVGDSYRDNTVAGYYNNRRWLDRFGVADDLRAPYGLLAANQSFKARVWFALVQPLGKGRVSYSWMLNFDQGSNWSAGNNAPTRITPVATYQGYQVTAATPLTYTRFYGGRGAYSWNDTHSVDFKINWEIPVGIARMAIIGDLKVNNLFNSPIAVAWDASFYNYSQGLNTLYMNNGATFGRTYDRQGAGNWVGARSVGFSLGLRF